MANERHLSTGHMSPQFHVVFDDLFETVVCNEDNDEVINSICDGLFEQITNSMLKMSLTLTMF